MKQLSPFQKELNLIIKTWGKRANEANTTWADIETMGDQIKKLIRRHAPQLFSPDFGYRLGTFELNEKEYQKVKTATNILGKILKRSK